MIPIEAYLAATHIADLRRAAASERLARETRLPDVDGHLPGGGGSESRRTLARVAALLSRAASETARRLDPSFEEPAHRRSAVPGC